MAAGLGFKDFVTGEVLTAADVDGYLMQGIWVFDDAAARDAAVTSPQEGNACYLKDTDEVLTYDGSVWVAVGGGGGGMTLISTTTLTGSTVTLSSISQDYVQLYLAYDSVETTALNQFRMRFNGDTATNYLYTWIGGETGYPFTFAGVLSSYIYVFTSTDTSTAVEKRAGDILINNYTSTGQKFGNYQGADRRGSSPQQYEFNVGSFNYGGSSAITSIELYMGAGTFTTGTVKLYGVK
jgi:hypothetical protein